MANLDLVINSSSLLINRARFNQKAKLRIKSRKILKKSIVDLLHKRQHIFNQRIEARRKLFEGDEYEFHYNFYSMFGFEPEESRQLDYHHHVSRILFSHIGTFIQDIAYLCFYYKYKTTQMNFPVKNVISEKPKKFKIDILVNNQAIELKWRESTTDGDHFIKEEVKVHNALKHDYAPIKLVFCDSIYGQSKKASEKMKRMYIKNGGQFISGIDAWKYLDKLVGFDVLKFIKKSL
jgi:hypothetical protein